MHYAPIMHPLLTALNEAVLHQDESMTQALAWNEDSFESQRWGGDDVNTPGTPAFHLHHTVLVFRYHARKAIKIVDPDIADDALDALIPHHEASIPLKGEWSPRGALEDLAASLHAFSGYLSEKPDAVYDTPIDHNRPFTLATFLNMMTRHVTWHAAAVHYRARPVVPGGLD